MTDELIDHHLQHLKAGGQSPRTIEARESVLRRLHERLPFGLLYAATEQIEAWLADMRDRGCSQNTLNVYHWHVAEFYRWATVGGFLDGNPSATIKAPKKPQGLPKPVSEAFLSRLLELPEPWRTAVILAAFEGMRASEIAACRKEHIAVDITTIPTGKGGDPGAVPTHPFVWEQLGDLGTGPFFVDNWGRPVSGHWVTTTFGRRLESADLRHDEKGKQVHLHRLRHRYGTEIQREVKDIRITQECLRHRSVTSTQIYTLVTGQQRANAVATLQVPSTGCNTEVSPSDVSGKGTSRGLAGSCPPAAEAA